MVIVEEIATALKSLPGVELYSQVQLLQDGYCYYELSCPQETAEVILRTIGQETVMVFAMHGRPCYVLSVRRPEWALEQLRAHFANPYLRDKMKQEDIVKLALPIVHEHKIDSPENVRKKGFYIPYGSSYDKYHYGLRYASHSLKEWLDYVVAIKYPEYADWVKKLIVAYCYSQLFSFCAQTEPEQNICEDFVDKQVIYTARKWTDLLKLMDCAKRLDADNE